MTHESRVGTHKFVGDGQTSGRCRCGKWTHDPVHWTNEQGVSRAISAIDMARIQVMEMYGGNLDHPALDHLEAAMESVKDTDKQISRG